MTLEEVLNLMDHEVWVRVRVNDGREEDPANDLVLWSADWIGGGEDDPGMPDGLKDVLCWDADDISVEMYDDPEVEGAPGPKDRVPMLVVNAYDFAQEPHMVYVLVKLADYGSGEAASECSVFLDEGCAEAAMRDDYDAEIDSRDCDVDKDGSHITSVDATLRFLNGVKIKWTICARTTEDNDYR